MTTWKRALVLGFVMLSLLTLMGAVPAFGYGEGGCDLTYWHITSFCPGQPTWDSQGTTYHMGGGGGGGFFRY
jgi:hypothetical protein